MRWGMLINLVKCVGCYSCVAKCKQEHFLPPEVMWSRVLISETGTYPRVNKQVYPVLCNHCKEAKCVQACPATATQKREGGRVWVDPNKCVGCRYCLIACPYQARTFYSKPKEYFPGQGLTEFEQMGEKLYPLQTGTVIKCNFCMERVDSGIKQGLKPGVDREATPACVITCPAKARYFGDLDDPESEISALISKWRAVPLHPEYGTEPSVHYVIG
jgi:phenylacetyl-CoA:acceptor oxidoreductase 27-kDa subunit